MAEQSISGGWGMVRDNKHYCNSFTDRNKVIVGHDYGAAVWIQPVNLNIEDRITDKCVHEVGMEISVELDFFEKTLEEGFVKFFNPELEVNSKRYTKAFSDEGRYLTGFEREILEPNFFTYEEIRDVIGYYERSLTDYDSLSCSLDVSNLIKVIDLLKKMIALTPDADYISVMS